MWDQRRKCILWQIDLFNQPSTHLQKWDLVWLCRPSHTVTGWHCLLKYGRLQNQKTKLALILHTNERKWQQLPFQLHLIIDKIPIRLGQGELTYIFCFHYNVQNASCAVCSSKWCCILHSDQFKLLIFTDLLNFHSPVSCYFPLLLHSLIGCQVLLCYYCHQKLCHEKHLPLE